MKYFGIKAHNSVDLHINIAMCNYNFFSFLRLSQDSQT